MKRPFWMHQLVEYLLGVLLVSEGIRTSKPAVPAVIGALLFVNAATVSGPLAAFSKVPRRVHRILDLVLIGLLVAGGLLPGRFVSQAARAIVLGLAAVFAVVVWRTDYTPKPVKVRRPPTPPAERSEQIGRIAGRTTAKLYNAARQRKRS